MSWNSSESKTSPHSRHSTNSASSCRETIRTLGCLQTVAIAFKFDRYSAGFPLLHYRAIPCQRGIAAFTALAKLSNQRRISCHRTANHLGDQGLLPCPRRKTPLLDDPGSRAPENRKSDSWICLSFPRSIPGARRSRSSTDAIGCSFRQIVSGWRSIANGIFMNLPVLRWGAESREMGRKFRARRPLKIKFQLCYSLQGDSNKALRAPVLRRLHSNWTRSSTGRAFGS